MMIGKQTARYIYYKYLYYVCCTLQCGHQGVCDDKEHDHGGRICGSQKGGADNNKTFFICTVIHIMLYFTG